MPETTKKELTMDDLKGIIAEAVKNETASGLESLRNEIKEVERKSIFSDAEGKLWQSHTGSVIDTSYFNKDYATMRFGRKSQMTGEEMAHFLMCSGGPFVKLSPIMEKFAIILACKGDMDRIRARGINIVDYNREVLEAEKKTAPTSLTVSDAGALVPTEYFATVIEFAIAQSKILGMVFRIPLTAQVLKIPKLVQAAGSYFGGVTLYHPDELEEKTVTKPTFDTLTFTAKKTIGLIPMSDEVIKFSAIALVNYVTALVTRAFQWNSEKEILAGTGSNNQMLGIINDPGVNLVSRKTVGTVVFDDFVNLESAIDENFQDLTYVTRRATINQARLKKTTTNAFQFVDGVSGMGLPVPPQINGYPYVKTRNVPVMGSQGDVVLGDFGHYIWVVDPTLQVDFSKERWFEYDISASRFVIYMDGKPGISIAFAILDNLPES